MNLVEISEKCSDHSKPTGRRQIQANEVEFIGQRFESVEDAMRCLGFCEANMVQIGEHSLLLISASLIKVAPISVKWFGQVPKVVFDFGRIVGEINGSELSVGKLGRLIRMAKIARRSSFRRCPQCRRLTPPEYRIVKQCHTCFEKSGGAF